MSTSKLNVNPSYLLLELWRVLSKKSRLYIILLFTLIIASAFFDVISIGAVVPFLIVLVNPDEMFKVPLLKEFSDILNLSTDNQLLLIVTVAFCIAVMTACTIRLLVLWFTTKISFSVGSEISICVYERTLKQDYSAHLSRNSSEIIGGVLTKSNAIIYNVFLPSLNIASSITLMGMIFIALFYVSFKITMLLFFVISLIYYLITKYTKKHLNSNSHLIAKESGNVIKLLQEGLGGIREIIIDDNHDFYTRMYAKADIKLRKSQGYNQFIGSAPRFFIEAIGIIFLVLIAYHLIGLEDGGINVIPTLGVVVLASQKLLPVAQNLYASWASFKGGQQSILEVVNLLNQDKSSVGLRSDTQIIFDKKIELEKISFKYDNQSQFILKDISLEIKKGARIGFIGVSGSGKSTLLDILMGLLFPVVGQITVDGVPLDNLNIYSWRKKIAHVPQHIYLTDASLAENIAFGVPKSEINMEAVQLAAKKAQIADLIDSMPKRYDTNCGERGINLSGGQRQRIGIARALYKKSEIIFFDEATSALDSSTEESLIDAIYSLNSDITLLIVAHRISTLSQCDHIVEITNGGIARICSYKDLI